MPPYRRKKTNPFLEPISELITRSDLLRKRAVDTAITSSGQVDAGQITGAVPVSSQPLTYAQSIITEPNTISYATDLKSMLIDMANHWLIHIHDERYYTETEFPEVVDDRVNALVIAGTGITKVYDDVANTLTIAATGGGGGMANPMTTPADIIVGGTAGAPARLAKGTAGQVLTVDSTTGLLAYATPTPGGMADPTTTKGDLITRNATVTTRLSVGTNGHLLTADSAEATGVKWSAAPVSASLGGWSSVIGVAGTALVGGEYLSYEVPFGCTLTAVRAWSPVSGSATVTVSRATYAALPTFTALGSLAITTATKAEDTALTGWTATAIASGDWLRLQVTGTPTTIDQLHVSLRYTRS